MSDRTRAVMLRFTVDEYEELFATWSKGLSVHQEPMAVWLRHVTLGAIKAVKVLQKVSREKRAR